MVYTRRPTSNMDTMDGALMHMLTICGPLSDASIDVFIEEFRDMQGLKYFPNFGSKILIPQLARQRKIFQTGRHLYSTNPMLRQNKDGLDSFWVFLEHMAEADIDSVMKHRNFGNLSYVKNNIIYTIFRCRDNGAKALALASQHEMIRERDNKRNPKLAFEERYIFVFSREEDMKAAPFLLRSPTLFGLIKYEDPLIPTLWFDRASNVLPQKGGID